MCIVIRVDKNLAQWYKAASAFAQFYSICFLPHPDLYGDDLELELYKRQKYLSWETFADQIKEMEASNLLIDRLRLDAMFTYIYGLRSDHRKQMLLTNYRHHDNTKWSELEKKDASNFFASVGTRQHFSKDQDADDVHDQLAMKAFSTIKTNEMYRKIKFCGVQSDTLDFIFSNKTDS